MGDFTISGRLRPDVAAALGLETATVRWFARGSRVETDPPELLALLRVMEHDPDVRVGALPTVFAPPYLRYHEPALCWLRGEVFDRTATVTGDTHFNWHDLPPDTVFGPL